MDYGGCPEVVSPEVVSNGGCPEVVLLILSNLPQREKTSENFNYLLRTVKLQTSSGQFGG